MDVTVIDSRGRSVTSLSADDFEIREDGQPQPITSFKLIEAKWPLTPLSIHTTPRAARAGQGCCSPEGSLCGLSSPARSA